MTVSDTVDDLVPLTDDAEQPPTAFTRVLRGYDPKQVEDYLDRVEVALNDADERHAEDGRRISALEQQVAELTARLAETERRASGKPEPASLAGERITRMLRLAEEEAAALRESARADAETLITEAKEKAAVESRERLKSLEKRERDVETAAKIAETARLEAQKDAESVRERAGREAERELAAAKARADALRADAEGKAELARSTARDDVRILHEQAQREAASITAEARREVEAMARQRDTIGRQLQQLNDAVAAAVAPLRSGSTAVRPSTGPGRTDQGA